MQNNHDGTEAPGLAAPSRLSSLDPHRVAPLAAAGAAHARIDRLPEMATPADKAGGDQRNTREERDDSAARTAVEQACKAHAAPNAPLALDGFELHIVTGDDGGAAYMVSRWAMHRELRDVAAVREFAERVRVAS